MAQTRLDFRVELNLQIRQAHKEASRHGEDRRMGRGKGKLSDQMKGKYCIFYEEVGGGRSGETGSGKNPCGGNEVDGSLEKRREDGE